MCECLSAERELSFRLTGENWELESVHLSGQLYEAIEVEHLVKLVPANGAFLDVGANIGNHSSLSRN